MTTTGIKSPADRRDIWTAAALGAVFLLLFLKTLCPTVYLGDSGDFVTAMVTGGIPHPPGYPVYTLLGRLFLLLPFGEPAFRVGCVSAVAGAGAVVVLFLTARELGCRRMAAAAAAALFGGGYSLWTQSVRVEVYSFHALLFGLVLLGALRYRRSGSAAALFGAALAGTVGVAHHVTIVLLCPALLVLCGKRLWSDEGRGARLLGLAAILPLGPLCYALLMAWSKANPLSNWGRPDTLHNLWVHISAKIYQDNLDPSLSKLFPRMAEAGRFFLDSFPYGLVLLPLAGAVMLWKRDRTAAVALIFAAVITFGYNLCYRIPDIAAYYIPVWGVAALLAAAALDAALRRLPSRPGSFAAVGALLFFMAALPILRNYASCDLSSATWVRDSALDKLRCAEPDSVLIIQGDHDTFPLWYVQDVLKIRPDVMVVDRIMVNSSWECFDQDSSLWYLHRLRKKGVDAPLDVPSTREERDRLAGDEYLNALLDGPLARRPHSLTFANTPQLTRTDRGLFWKRVEQRFVMTPQGIILRLNPAGKTIPLRSLIAHNKELWAELRMPDTRKVRTDQDVSPRYLTDLYASMLLNYGSLYQHAGMREKALAIYQVVTEYAPGYRPAAEKLAELRSSVASESRSGTLQP